MGVAAEMIAARYGIGREAQDAFAAESHRRAAAATPRVLFRDEILLRGDSGDPKRARRREFSMPTRHPPETTVEVLGRRPTGLQEGGTVTAAMRRVSDGAAGHGADERGPRHGTGTESAGPRFAPRPPAAASLSGFGLAPIEAVRKVAARAGWPLEQRGPVRAERGFRRAARWPLEPRPGPRSGNVQAKAPAKVNVQGGAVAIGHPSAQRRADAGHPALRLAAPRPDQASPHWSGGGNAVALTTGDRRPWMPN